MILVDSESNFSAEDKRRILQIKRYESQNEEKFEFPNRFGGSSITITARPEVLSHYGGIEGFTNELETIVEEAYKNAESFEEVIASIYALQGYSQKDLQSDIDEGHLEWSLSGVIEMEMEDRYFEALEEQMSEGKTT